MKQSQPPIPSSLRPSTSLIAHVRSTLGNFVSSVFKKKPFKKPVPIVEEDCETVKVHQSTIFDSSKHNRSDVASTLNSSFLKSQEIRTKDAFNRRLKSFTLSRWCGKPLIMSPPLLAQYGWECVGENIAKCCICSAIITVHLPWPNAGNYQQMCKEAQMKIIRGHKKICTWPNNPASDDYLNPFDEKYLTLEERDYLKKSFIGRAKRIRSLGEGLPHIKLNTYSEMGLDESSLLKLMNLCDFPNDSLEVEEAKIVDHAMRLSSVALALCGWDADFRAHLPTLHCNDTGRTVGLWNFYSVSPVDEDSDQVPTKRRKVEDKPSSMIIEKSWFHPIQQHHVWSPWIASLHSTSALLDDPSRTPMKSGFKPGWKVLRDIALDVDDAGNETNTSLKTPPRAAVLQARRMMKEWSSS